MPIPVGERKIMPGLLADIQTIQALALVDPHKNAKPITFPCIEEALSAAIMSSVVKKRRRRMNHHKHKKWLKKMRFRLRHEGRK
jgi:hypothetical protein